MTASLVIEHFDVVEQRHLRVAVAGKALGLFFSVGGTSITDVPNDFGLGNSAELIITVTNRVSEINGIVRDGLQATRPNQNGKFSVKGLPPGRYLVAAKPTLEDGLQHDPAVLEQLRQKASRFVLVEGQTLNLALAMAIE